MSAWMSGPRKFGMEKAWLLMIARRRKLHSPCGYQHLEERGVDAVLAKERRSDCVARALDPAARLHAAHELLEHPPSLRRQLVAIDTQQLLRLAPDAPRRRAEVALYFRCPAP